MNSQRPRQPSDRQSSPTASSPARSSDRTNPTPPQPPATSTGISLRQYAILVAAGAFATTFAQQRVLGNYPTTFLLKDHLGMSRQSVANFFFWATFAWNLKPLAGILTDAFPFLGTRRRSYMILGALTAGILWIVMGLFPERYHALLVASIGMNIAMVFASTVMGGLMVEAGQAYGAPGRISSLRQVVQSTSQIVAPLLGGWLAARTFGWTATTGIAAGTVIALAILVFFVLKERPAPKLTHQDVPQLELPRFRGDVRILCGLVGAAIGVYVAMRTGFDTPNHMIGGAIVILLFGVCGGLVSATSFIMARRPVGRTIAIVGLFAAAFAAASLFRNPDTNNIGRSLFALLAMFMLIVGLIVLPTKNPVVRKAQGQLVQILRSRTLGAAVIMLFLVYTVPGFNTALIYRQEDVLKFSKEFIGMMGSLEGAFGVLGALFYAFICRKFNLRVLLFGGVGINATLTLLYLLYSRTTAPFIHPLGGFVVVLSELALMDLAVRSTPAGCEALGFALMMSVRNFGIALSDVLGTKLLDQYHFEFNTLVGINAATTAVILLFVPFLPKIIMNRKEGQMGLPRPGAGAPQGEKA